MSDGLWVRLETSTGSVLRHADVASYIEYNDGSEVSFTREGLKRLVERFGDLKLRIGNNHDIELLEIPIRKKAVQIQRSYVLEVD